MKKPALSLLFCIGVIPVCIGGHIKVENLRTDHLHNPLGIDNRTPHLSWEIRSETRGTMQAAYQIRAAFEEKDLSAAGSLAWDSGKVDSGQSYAIPYKGTALKSRSRIYWQVRVWDQQGRLSDWSKVSHFEMGLLTPGEWVASWIEADINEDISTSPPAQYFRKEFELKGKVRTARLYITSRGLYEARLNGKKVGDQLFTPGWTSYRKRLQYQVYDVTGQLAAGKNAFGIVLGDGWWRGYLKWMGKKNFFGEKLAALAQLEISYADGTCETVVTDKSWRSFTGAILASDLYNGESYDARFERSGWDSVGFDDSESKGVIEKNFPKDVLIASESVPVKAIEELKPQKKIITPKGETVFDFGQNFVGIPSIKLSAARGTQIKLTFAEVLDQDGNFYTKNLRTAEATDEYIFKGEGGELIEPLFTFHGFRYMKIEGYEGEISLDDIKGKIIHSAIPVSGTFVCSDPMINQLQSNIMWSLKGNFLDIPTDCNQRDERLGWTGDVQVFAPTACFNVDAQTFFTKWLKDLKTDQLPNGSIPHVIPQVAVGNGSTAWCDVSVTLPWELYRVYGDKDILSGQYESMKKWVDFSEKRTNGTYVVNTGRHYGDWLAFSNKEYPMTDKGIIATSFFAHSASLLGRIAELLGKDDDAKKYSEMSEQVKQAYRREYMDADGRLKSHTQTAYVLALAFDLYPAELRQAGVNYLRDDVLKQGHITTGFLGTPLISNVLSDNGLNEQAYMLLFRKEYPSWLYPITKGATTIWERWDGIKPDGTLQNPGMNSFNHYSYGAVGNWLYTRVAGLGQEPDSVAYKKIVIKPHISSGLSSARASFHSMYGEIVSGWEIKDRNLAMTVVIPPNTSARVYLPVKSIAGVTEGGRPLDGTKEILHIGSQEGYEIVEIGSGNYLFSMPYEEQAVR